MLDNRYPYRRALAALLVRYASTPMKVAPASVQIFKHPAAMVNTGDLQEALHSVAWVHRSTKADSPTTFSIAMAATEGD